MLWLCMVITDMVLLKWVGVLGRRFWHYMVRIVGYFIELQFILGPL